jgi:rubredoxin
MSTAAPNKKWQCFFCGFVYDEALGLPDEGIAPGTSWENIPDDWKCPACGTAKAEFLMLEYRLNTDGATPL